MPGKDPQTIKAVNGSGNFTFNSSAGLVGDLSRLFFNCTDQYKIESSASSLLRTTSGNANVEVNTDHLNLLAGKANSNSSILLDATNSTGGIKLNSGTGGITQYSTGNIDINAKDANINIGVFAQGITNDQTNNVIIEANDNITATSTDFQVITSDAIQLISLTGDITLGSSVGSSIIKFEDDNLLINQTTSSLDAQLDIKITDEASSSVGYNGIVVNSSNTQVGADITLQTNDSNASISMGVEPQSSKYSSFKHYIAMQTGTTIIPIYGEEFTNADIGRRIYWTSTDASDTIQSLSKIILSASNTYASTTLTTSGTYTGSSSKIYRIEIDSVGSPNTFKWSSDGGQTYTETYRNVSTSAITLEEGVQIAFSALTGNNLGDYWTFQTKITAIVSTSREITNSEKLNILQEFNGYIKTSNISDIKISTANNERMRITADGSIGIGNNIPTSTFEVYNKVGKPLLLNEYDTNYQLNPSVAKLKFGGYVSVWESKAQDGDDYGIYIQQLTADGHKFGNQTKVNITTAGHQSNPHIAGRNITNSRDYAVVWASEESDGSGVYDIYANVYINGTRLKTSDVLVNSANSDNKQLHPRIVGLTDGTYLIVWSSDDSNTGDYNIYGRIMNNAGILVGSRFQITSTSDSYSVLHPYPFAISDSDATIPGGYGVVFMNEYDSQDTSGSGVNDDNRYNIQYRLFNSSGTAQINDTDITDSSGNRITLSDGLVSAIGLENGGFALSFYRNYEGKGSLYNVGDRVDGDSSGITSGTIASISDNVLTVSGLTSTERYLVGETITIENFWTEKIHSVSHTGGGTAVITLSNGHSQISLFKYSTNSTTPTLNNIQVNTSSLIDDIERTNAGNTPDNMRNTSIFPYRRPMASITELENNTLCVAWTSGRIPNIYYQIINSSNGSKINNEKQADTINSALKQRNVVIAGIETIEGQDAGIAMIWDIETLDTDASGVYHTIINPNKPIMRVYNQNTEFSLSQNGDLGIGTQQPNDKLHIITSDNTSNIIVQNSSSYLTNLTTNRDINNIVFKDRDNILGIINSGHSENYQSLHPNYDNLVSYYPFDDEIGSNALSDLSQNKNDGRIENFDIYKDWNTSNGKINGCLEFNGSNNYISLGQISSLYNLSTSSTGYTINGWVKLPNYISTSSNLDIICNGGNLSIEGTYLMYLSDIGSNSSIYLNSSLTTSSGLQISNGSGSTISLGEWHMITNVYHTANTTLENYIDGTFNSSTQISGTVNSAPTSNVYVGSRDTSNGFFRGNMDELKIYNTNLTRENISKLYNYGNEIKGKITINTQDGSNTWNNSVHGLTIDDTGSVQGLLAKNHSFKRISGTTTTYLTSKNVLGTGTKYRDNLRSGDIINVSGTELVVTKVISDTALNVDRSTSNTNTTKLVRKPSIFTMLDIDDNLKGLVDYDGNMIIGTGKPVSMLEVRGASSDLPYLNLTNTTEGDTNGARETRLIFRGTNDDTQHNLGYISSSHSGTGDDTKGKMQIYVNDGSSTVEAIRIKHDANVAIGVIDPLSKLHINDPQDCEIVMTSGSNAEQVFGETNKIYFTGSNTIGDNPSGGLMYNSLSMIRGSSDSNSINVDGRIDFYTNNNTDNIGLQNRMSILSNGYIGAGIHKPYTKFQATSEISTVSGITGSQSGTTITLSENFTNDDAIGGIIVFNNDIQTARKITARPNATTLTVSESGTVSSSSVDIFYGGLCVDNRGNVSVGTVSSLSKLHVEGVQSSALSTKNNDYTLTYRDSTILGDASGGSITLTLPNTIGYNGLKYNFVRINSGVNTVTVNTTGASTINGVNSIVLTSQYNYLNVQSNGTNWYITSSNI